MSIKVKAAATSAMLQLLQQCCATTHITIAVQSLSCHLLCAYQYSMAAAPEALLRQLQP